MDDGDGEPAGDPGWRAGALADGYALEERPPSVDAFQSLRAANDMARRSRAGVERGLPNSSYAVVVVHEPSGETVAMGRVISDGGERPFRSRTSSDERRESGGGSVFHVCDMAVHPDHQRRGLGTAVMEAILAYVDETAPPRAYVNLMADVDGFYERFGFEETRPASKGMFLRTD